MLHLILFLIEIILAAILGGILGYGAHSGRPQYHVQILTLIAIGAAAFTEASLRMAGDATGWSPGILITGILISAGILAAGLSAREAEPDRRVLTGGAVWMAAAVGVLTGGGMLIRAVLLTGLAYYVLRYLPDVFRRRDDTRPDQENE